MSHFVYIIKSLKDGSFYKGYSSHPLLRLQRHNNGETASTRHLTPWVIVFIQLYPSKKEALIREKAIKKYSRAQIEQLINSPLNQINLLNH